MQLISHLTSLSAEVDIAQHMADTFGVNVVREGDLYLFKYGQLTAQWSHKVTHECRGVILRRDNDLWKIVSRPFDKFFNRHEGHCLIFEPSAFEAQAPGLAFVEKADGTCIQVWFDGEVWRASTLGTISPKNVMGESFTFDHLFFETSGLDTSLLVPGHTYIFELCTDYNQIVTRYKENHCVLLGVRSLSDGSLLSRGSEPVVNILRAHKKIRLPQHFTFEELGVKCVDSAHNYVESSKDDPWLGVNPEGWVVVCRETGEPKAKMKNSRYVELHHLGGGDEAHSRNCIIESFFMGNFDDVRVSLVQMESRLLSFADELAESARKLITEQSHELLKLVQSGPYETQKDFALAVQGKTGINIDPRLRGLCFEMKKRGRLFTENPSILLEEWLSKGGYKKFMDRWKS